MNNSKLSDERENDTDREPLAVAGAEFGPGPQASAGSLRQRRRACRTLPCVLLMVALAPIAACSGTPERHAYEIADARAEWLDRFSADRRACASLGGVIVQERHQPDSLRVGDSRPEVGTRYYCRY